MQKPSHAAFTASPKSSKSNPRALRRSVIPCVNSVNVPLICSQMLIILFRKSSFVCHRCTNAAAKSAITPTAAENPAVDTFKAPVTAENPFLMLPRILGIFAIACISVPTTEITFPIAISNGEIAATAKAIFTIVSFTCGSN